MGEINVRMIFDDSLITVTQQIAGLTLRSKDKVQFGNSICYMGIIHTKGRFAAMIQFVWSEDMYNYIISRMTNGASMSDEDKTLYMNEYMNITCGHALSAINNKIGRPSSRLSIPAVYKELEEGVVNSGKADMSELLNYDTEHGKMQVEINYAMGQ